MSIDEALTAAVRELVPELVAAVRAEIGRPRMLPIKEAPLAYRAILDAERRGEIAVYRVGHGSFVDEAELYEFIRKTGAKRVEPVERDEVTDLITAGDARRRTRGGHAA